MEHKFTILIITLNAIVTYMGLSNDTFLNKYLFSIGRIRAGEKYRMITSGFLHADWIHFAFNMISFWSFSSILESVLGITKLAIIYFGSLLMGNFLTLKYFKNNINYAALGASGAVSGVVFSFVILFPNEMVYAPILMPCYLYAILYLGISLYGMKSSFGNIGHTAHIGGAIAGVFILLLFQPSLIAERSIFLIGFALIIVILYVLMKQNNQDT